MGVNIADLLVRKEIDLQSLKGKIIAVDAHLFLYQFLTTIRQRDGAYLTDSKGTVTSHLAGLFNRNTKLMQAGISLVYVFDGKPPALKNREIQKRKEAKEKSELMYEQALAEEDLDKMKKYSQRTVRLTPQMIEESKELLAAMGIPVIEAPSEGEAQAAMLVKENAAFAVASQDADSLLFGSPRLVRNLSISGRKKKANKLAFEEVRPELVLLKETLESLSLTEEKLIALGMLVGTDFNYDGIKGIGPKKALDLVRKFDSLQSLFNEVKWSEHYDYPWEDVYNIFVEMPVKKALKLEFGPFNYSKVKSILVDKHDFSEERVDSTIEKFELGKGKNRQKGLSEFF